jgi:hypothetical protein
MATAIPLCVVEVRDQESEHARFAARRSTVRRGPSVAGQCHGVCATGEQRSGNIDPTGQGGPVQRGVAAAVARVDHGAATR